MRFEDKPAWQIAPLRDLLTFKAGGAFSRDLQGRTAGDFPFIKVSDMYLGVTT